MKKILFIPLVLTLMYACKKEDQENTAQNQTMNYPLAIGNYWVYEWFKIDSNGNESPMQSIDTMRVTDSLNHEGSSYFILESTGNLPTYTISATNTSCEDRTGNIIYDLDRALDTLNESIVFDEFILHTLQRSPANYTINFQGETKPVTVSIEYHYYRLDNEDISPCSPSVQISNAYTTDIGLVQGQVVQGSEMETDCSYREFRLVDYQLN